MCIGWSHNALQCDGCDIWSHAACMDMSSREYRQLGKTSSVWICCRCGLRNIDSSLFRSRGSSHDDNNDLYSTSNTSALSSAAGSPGPPQLASTPNRTSTPTTWHRSPGLVIVNVNWQSVTAKKLPLHHMIESVKPDVIVGTESWLKSDIASSEVFPLEDYQVIRKDRTNRKGGGVFIMARREFKLVREEELETDCELIWGGLSIYGWKPLHIGAYYRREEKDKDSLHQLQMSLSRLKKTDSIVLAGDFNLPGWNWKDNYVKTSCQHPRLHEKFGNIINDAGLEQIIDLPTRLDNTFHLVCTSTPSKVNRTEILPPPPYLTTVSP